MYFEVNNEMSIKKRPSNLVKSVNRVIDILEELAKQKNGLRVTEISNRLDLPNSSVSRLLSTLAYRSLVTKDEETNKYNLGLKIFELGSYIFNDLKICECAKPYLKGLVEEVNETGHLAVLDQGEIVYVDKVESLNPIRMYSRRGGRAPAYCTGTGKAILAYKPEEEIDIMLEHKSLIKHTDFTITDPYELKKELQKIRDRGYAFDEEEFQPGVKCIAVPIFDYSGEVVGAVGIAGPVMRISKKKCNQMIDLLKKTGRAISSHLGYNKR